MARATTVHHSIFRVGPGWMTAEATPRGLCRLSLPLPTRAEAEKLLGDESAPAPEHDRMLAQARRELAAYFGGTLARFHVPVDLSSLPPFRQQVLLALMRVPYGATVTYGALAAAIGTPGAARAVGQALARNPVAIIVPCHRVIGADGRLTGFGGGLPWKRALLALEQGDPSALLGLARAVT